MCTSGWIKTSNGAILFKNRDRDCEEKINSSFLHKEDGLVFLSDKHFGGAWFGWNGHIAISDTLGAHQEICEGRASERESFAIMEQVLRETRAVPEATALYQKLFLEKKIGKSYNILIADENQCNVIEMVHDITNVKTHTQHCFCANKFTTLEEWDKTGNEDAVARSAGRQSFCESQIDKKDISAQEIIETLSSHEESVCRHGVEKDDGDTVATAVLEINRNVTLHYCLNAHPCEGKFAKLHLDHL